jgi:hypothetical protein
MGEIALTPSPWRHITSQQHQSRTKTEGWRDIAFEFLKATTDQVLYPDNLRMRVGFKIEAFWRGSVHLWGERNGRIEKTSLLDVMSLEKVRKSDWQVQPEGRNDDTAAPSTLLFLVVIFWAVPETGTKEEAFHLSIDYAEDDMQFNHLPQPAHTRGISSERILSGIIWCFSGRVSRRFKSI